MLATALGQKVLKQFEQSLQEKKLYRALVLSLEVLAQHMVLATAPSDC